jgi:3-methyladenine DNA glycosylase AlkD
MESVTPAPALDVEREVRVITKTLESRRDPAYERGLRRTVPSEQPVHATRHPDIRKAASEWRKTHKSILPHELFTLCDALWASGWREERIVAIYLAGGTKAARDELNYDRLVRWSADIDNWELVDNMADVAGRKLIADPSLLARTNALTKSDNPWQRRLGLVTLIVAFMKGASFRDELSNTADQLQKDPHPLVRRAVVWARDRLKKDHLQAPHPASRMCAP